MTDDARPQDAGRKRNRRQGQPSAETTALLERYQRAMRDDLGAILTELEPKAPDPGLGLVDAPPERLGIVARTERWKLAVTLARELGAAIDAPPPTEDGPAAPRTRRRRPDYGGE